MATLPCWIQCDLGETFSCRAAAECQGHTWRLGPAASLGIPKYTYTYTYIHYITLHYITLHYITLHYITLHYITLHYITLHIYIYTRNFLPRAKRVQTLIYVLLMVSTISISISHLSMTTRFAEEQHRNNEIQSWGRQNLWD